MHVSFDESARCACISFAFNSSGYGYWIYSTKKPTPSSTYVKIYARKVVPWPEDVRDGDLVQTVLIIQRPSSAFG